MRHGGKFLATGMVLFGLAAGASQLFPTPNAVKETRKFPSFRVLDDSTKRVFDDSTKQKFSREQALKRTRDMTFDELMTYIESYLGINAKKDSLLVSQDSSGVDTRRPDVAKDSIAAADKFAAEQKRLADSVAYAKKLEENKLLSQKDSTDNANLLEKRKLTAQKDSVENARQMEFSRLKAMRDSVDNATRLFEKQKLAIQKDSVENAQKLANTRLKAQKDSVEKANNDAALKFETEQAKLQEIYISITDRMWEADGLSFERIQTLKTLIGFVEKNAGRLKVELDDDFAELKTRVAAREKHFADEKLLMEKEKKRREGLEIIEPLPLGRDSSAVRPNNIAPVDTVKKVEADTAGFVVPNKEQIETGPLPAPSQNMEKKPVNEKKIEPLQIKKEENTGKEIIE